MRIEGSNMAVLPQESIRIAQTSANTTEQPSVSDRKGFDSMLISQITPLERREMPVSEKVVIDAIERANKAIMGANKKFEFSIHEKTKEIMVKVIDTDTNEIIREIPNEKVLDMVAKLCEMAGVLVDEKR